MYILLLATGLINRYVTDTPKSVVSLKCWNEKYGCAANATILVLPYFSDVCFFFFFFKINVFCLYLLLIFI